MLTFVLILLLSQAEGATLTCKSKITRQSCAALCKTGSTACKTSCTKKKYCPCKLKITKQSCTSLCRTGSTTCKAACIARGYCPCTLKTTKSSCAKICKTGSAVCKAACNNKKMCPVAADTLPYACWLDKTNTCYISNKSAYVGGPKCTRPDVFSKCLCGRNEEECLQHCNDVRSDIKLANFGNLVLDTGAFNNIITYSTCCTSTPDCNPECSTHACICAKFPDICPQLPTLFPH